MLGAMNTYLLCLVLIFMSITYVQGERIAAQKCAEYRKVVTRKEQVIHLLVNPIPHVFEVYNCSNDVKLIAGGEDALYGEFPHHALLGYPREDKNERDLQYLCGGTLISEQHVLTAAHCFADIDPVVVRLGDYDTSYYSDDEFEFDIASFRKHPEHSARRSYHDIALIKLKYPVKLTKHIRPACLWTTENRNSTKYVATGFGYTETYGTVQSTTMKKVQLDEFPVDDCAKMMRGNRKFPQGIHDGQLCVGSLVEGRDTCPGDSGGPLQQVIEQKSCMYAVVGVTSIGPACGVGQSKAIYTKISYYIDWIEDNVWGPNAL